MAQRAAMCRMLIAEPDVLLLDEPFSALDEISRDFMNMELQRICLERRRDHIPRHPIRFPEAVILSDVVYVMSPRPGRFVEAVEIDLPRPRTLDMLSTPRFGEYTNRSATASTRGPSYERALNRLSNRRRRATDTIWDEKLSCSMRFPAPCPCSASSFFSARGSS